jgi:uncharacterized repeat protein (TIGR03803 family)
MTAQNHLANVNTGNRPILRSGLSALLIVAVMCLAALATPLSRAQSFQVLHSFTGKSGGASSYGQLILDREGNVYGTTSTGGFYGAAQCSGAGCGLVFRLNPAGQQSAIYSFEGRGSGALPAAGLVRDAQGNFYGTTEFGGYTNDCSFPPHGCGTVFKIDVNGHETVLHRFTGGNDGLQPRAALIRDMAGNLYGTTTGGGAGSDGTVFKIDSAGNETILHSFTGKADGGTPLGGLVIDDQGNLYGGTTGGGTEGKLCGFGCGVIFKIDSAGHESVLYSFSGGADGGQEVGPLLLDSVGNLYGMTAYGGNLSCFPPYGCGVVFELDPTGKETVLYRFANETANGYNPLSGLVRDASGNFYGTTYRGGANGLGTVFKLDAYGNETLLHSFTGGADGADPYAGLTMDAGGNLCGTTVAGGLPGCIYDQGCGVVFKITP